MFDCTVTRQPSVGLVNLRANQADDDAIAAIEAVLQQSLPLQPNTTSTGSYQVYWLGPDEWLVVSRDESSPVAELQAELSGHVAAVNDVSGGLCRLRVDGADARQMLNGGCTLDLGDDAFPGGTCAQSNLGKANVLLGYSGDGPVYEIIVRRSFCDYLVSWLSQHAKVLPDSASCS